MYARWLNKFLDSGDLNIIFSVLALVWCRVPSRSSLLKLAFPYLSSWHSTQIRISFSPSFAFFLLLHPRWICATSTLYCPDASRSHLDMSACSSESLLKYPVSEQVNRCRDTSQSGPFFSLRSSLGSRNFEACHYDAPDFAQLHLSRMDSHWIQPA